MKFYYALFILLLNIYFIFPRSLMEVFNTPTAVGPDRSTYHFDTFLKENGGVVSRVSFGINPYIYLGFNLEIGNFIGKGNPEWNIPNFRARISFLGRTEEDHNFAIGWHQINSGTFSDYLRPVYGPYLVYSKGFYFANERAHITSVGLRVSATEKPVIPYFFTSITFRLFKFIDYGIEFDNIKLRNKGQYDFVNTHVIGIYLTEQALLRVAIQFGIDVSEVDRTQFADILGRNFFFAYQGYF